MYRFAAAVFLLVCFTLDFGGADIKARDKLLLTTGEWRPYTSNDAPHNGAAAQLVREAFATAGIDVQFGFFPWTRAMKLARDGKWHGSIVWYDTRERRSEFFYSDPLAQASIAFFHLKSRPFDWTTFEDLSRLTVGGTRAYSYGAEFDAAERAGTFNTQRTISDEVGLTNLLNGRIDVFPGELLVTYWQIRNTFPEAEAARFTHNPKIISELPLHMILSKKVEGARELRDRFNEGLAILRRNGRYDQIITGARSDR